MTDKPSIRSLAGHVLATDEDPEKLRLAAAVLGDDSLTPDQPKTKEELERLLSKIEGQEGQTERANAIRRELDKMS
jgi:hypothetical protein